MKPLLPLLLLTSVLVLTRCELPLDEFANEGGPDSAAAADVAADAGAGDDPADVVVDPVPCSALGGQWQVALCGANAVAVQFAAAGCAVQLVSPAAEFDGGVAELRQPVTLRLALPGGVYGQLACEAWMAPASFDGVCQAAAGRCPIAGVRVW